jgi:ABC-type uncharacterized transport system permease subunit
MRIIPVTQKERISVLFATIYQLSFFILFVFSLASLWTLRFSIEYMPGVAGAQAFWESAESILRTVSFNLALFSIVTVLI